MCSVFVNHYGFVVNVIGRPYILIIHQERKSSLAHPSTEEGARARDRVARDIIELFSNST